eukprot:1159883-Pelagomonas_calceolata.AAC.10
MEEAFISNSLDSLPLVKSRGNQGHYLTYYYVSIAATHSKAKDMFHGSRCNYITPASHSGPTKEMQRGVIGSVQLLAS